MSLVAKTRILNSCLQSLTGISEKVFCHPNQNRPNNHLDEGCNKQYGKMHWTFTSEAEKSMRYTACLCDLCDYNPKPKIPHTTLVIASQTAPMLFLITSCMHIWIVLARVCMPKAASTNDEISMMCWWETFVPDWHLTHLQLLRTCQYVCSGCRILEHVLPGDMAKMFCTTKLMTWKLVNKQVFR